MYSEWGLRDEDRPIADFTDNLARDIKKGCVEKGNIPTVATYALDKNTGFMIQISYHGKHRMDVMVSRSRGVQGKLTIDRFWGINPMGISTGGCVSTPDELRATAQIYEDVAETLTQKFGNPISEHDNRSIYRASLEEVVA